MLEIPLNLKRALPFPCDQLKYFSIESGLREHEIPSSEQVERHTHTHAHLFCSVVHAYQMRSSSF